jgi:hypothetical protein
MNYYFFDGRGLNSLQILSWLQSAQRLCDASPSSKCVHRHRPHERRLCSAAHMFLHCKHVLQGAAVLD